MTDEQTSHAISHIEAMFGRKYPAGSLAMLSRDLAPHPVAVMIAVAKKLEADNLNTLPAPVLLKKMVNEQVAVLREQKAAQEKRQHQQAQAGLARPSAQTTEIGKRTCQLVRALMIGKITRQEYLDGLLHLDKLYPKAGFAVEAGRIKLRYERQRLPLDQCAQGGEI